MENDMYVLPMHTAVMAAIIKGCGYKTYLELGIRFGESYIGISPIVELAVGVDIANHGAVPAGRFFHMTTDEFFKMNTAGFDVIFIDAAHNFEQVRTDFENAVKCLNPGGTLFLHDTDPCDPCYLTSEWCDTSCKMNKYLKESGKYQFVTLPTDICGMSIVRRLDDNRSANFTPD